VNLEAVASTCCRDRGHGSNVSVSVSVSESESEGRGGARYRAVIECIYNLAQHEEGAVDIRALHHPYAHVICPSVVFTSRQIDEMQFASQLPLFALRGIQMLHLMMMEVMNKRLK